MKVSKTSDQRQSAQTQYVRQKSVNWEKQIRHTKRMVRVAFVLDTLILSMTITAALCLIFLDGSYTERELITALEVFSLFSLIVSVIIIAIVSHRAAKTELNASGGHNYKQTQGVVYDVVAEMATAARIPMPDVYVAETSVPNAYAISNGKQSAVVVTSALLQVLNREELQGVIGHEVGHLASGDCPDMTRLVALTAMTGLVSGLVLRYLQYGGGRSSRRRNDDDDGGNGLLVLIIVLVAILFLIFSPVLAKLVQSASSRDRERRADAFSAQLTRNPTALAKALIDLDNQDGVIDESNQEFYDKAAAIAFRVPARNKKGKKSKPYDTHPPTAERVQALVDMGADPNAFSQPNRLTVMQMMDGKA